MDNVDPELQLLAKGLKGTQHLAIGQHELITSPLVSRDAADLSGQFLQRGLLGTVHSVHSDGLPERPQDSRLYVNLAAPASGLVCGVQGSGKSHTVSCILESSLIKDPKLGSLPFPLATIVFHFDEENGSRPCEAAYLTEFEGGEPAAQEVVVLASPGSLETRRKVYSGLKHVRVEPLRISEQDLNASRILSMMGAENIATLPLYLHKALSILREMGSDGFTYREFKHRLAASRFDSSQHYMLEMRLQILDSFLRGTGRDVTSFFKPGRLLIIDLSDPFVEGSVAALLFNICLGLFIEWNACTGKLIVLDEAHKYLTNSDANHFTRSICSVIRQQRHLAARVIVSTQEPTVVPPSILDLVSWIICHRFSSPSWIQHIRRHVCVPSPALVLGSSARKQDGNDGDTGKNLRQQDATDLRARDAVESDWAKQVVNLRTGEALLFSPASLFVSTDNSLATLSGGYAVIKSRPRLTKDGGASILTSEFQEIQEVDDVPIVQASQEASNAQEAQIERNTTATTSTPSPPVPSSGQVVSNEGHSPNTGKTIKYDVLITVLNGLGSSTGRTSFNYNDLASALHRETKSPYPGKLQEFLREAEASGVVLLRGDGKKMPWMASLSPNLRVTTSAQIDSDVAMSEETHNPESELFSTNLFSSLDKSTPFVVPTPVPGLPNSSKPEKANFNVTTSIAATTVPFRHSNYGMLVTVIHELESSRGKKSHTQNDVGAALVAKHRKAALPHPFPTGLKPLLLEAEASGIITRNKGGLVSLVPNVTNDPNGPELPIQVATAKLPDTTDISRYEVLIAALRELESSTTQNSFNHNDVAGALHSKTSSPYPGKLRTFLLEAERAGIVNLAETAKFGGGMVSLNTTLSTILPSSTNAAVVKAAVIPDSESSSSTAPDQSFVDPAEMQSSLPRLLESEGTPAAPIMPSITSIATTAHDEYSLLITAIRELESSTGRIQFKQGEIRSALSIKTSGQLPFPGKLKDFLKTAKEAGIVQKQQKLISLVPNHSATSTMVNTHIMRTTQNLFIKGSGHGLFRKFAFSFRSHKALLAIASVTSITTAVVVVNAPYYTTQFW